MMPSHRHITPVKPRAISKAVLLSAKVAATISCQTAVLPSNTDCTSAATKAAKKKNAQILLSTVSLQIAPGIDGRRQLNPRRHICQGGSCCETGAMVACA